MRTGSHLDYAFFADGEDPWVASIPGTFLVKDEMLMRPLWKPPQCQGIWRCAYCGSQYWIKDEELSCKNCGAPRDI